MHVTVGVWHKTYHFVTQCYNIFFMAGVGLVRRWTSLGPPVGYFSDRLLCVPCGRLLGGEGWPLGSRSWYLSMGLSLSLWYPGSGWVLDCIDS